MGSSKGGLGPLSARLSALSNGGIAIPPQQSAALAAFYLSNLPHCALSSFKTSCFGAVTYQAILKMALRNKSLMCASCTRQASKKCSFSPDKFGGKRLKKISPLVPVYT
jgi:hypothetical protein